MNKTAKYSAAALILAAVFIPRLHAQSGVFETRDANVPEGKILSMEETILSRELLPQRDFWHFTGEGHELTEEKNNLQPVSKYTSENGSVYLLEGDKKKAIAVSEEDGIVFGTSVSRNEFGIEGGLFPSPDGKKLAFYRKDERQVTKFPLLDITTRTGSLKEIRYPMAGMTSEIITLGIYDSESGATAYVQVNDFDSERYLTNVSWSLDSKRIYIQVLDRAQRHMHLNEYSAMDGSFIKTILTEENERFTEPLDPIWFIDDNTFIYRTDNRDGYRNLYLCTTSGSVERLTKTDADVEYLGKDAKFVYYASFEVSPVERHLFRVGIAKKNKGKVERLSQAPGWHSFEFSPDMTMYIDRYSSLNNPGTSELCSVDGKTRKLLLQSEDPTKGYSYTKISLGTVKSADGKYDNWYRMIFPKDFDPSKKYPVIVYVYGGPHSQMVNNSFLGQLRRWEMYMAQRGWLVYVQDNRGTSNRGAEYEKAIYGQCGQCEMADQMEGVKMLMELPYVDKDRIGVHGWSYGGFMTISLMTNYPDVFKVGVAGGPVIDWKWYEVMYGERYMSTPQNNPEGFSKTSLIGKVGDLKGKLLICQGAVDNTVVWEHSLSFVQECIKQNVQVDYFPYPCSEHNVFGTWRVHLMDKVSMYFEDYL